MEARISTTPSSSLPPTGICQSEPRDLGSEKNRIILASTDDRGAITVFRRGSSLLATNYGLALSLPLSHTPTTGKGSLGQISFGTTRNRIPAHPTECRGQSTPQTPVSHSMRRCLLSNLGPIRGKMKPSESLPSARAFLSAVLGSKISEIVLYYSVFSDGRKARADIQGGAGLRVP